MTTFSSTALRNLSQLLRTEDDLDKVESLKEQLIKEKTAIDVQLKSHTQTQLDRMLESMNSLTMCQDDVKTLKENVEQLDSIAVNSFGAISRYELINKISRVHEVFTQSTRIADKVASFHDELKEIDDMIEAENYNDIDIDSEVPSLLLIHWRLNKFRDFQDQIVELSLRSSDDARFTVKRLTSKTQFTVKKWDTLLENIISGLVESVKVGNHGLVVRFAKIIEYEERHDARISTIKEVLQKNEADVHAGLFQQIVKGSLQHRVYSRDYKQFFLTKLKENVHETFHNCWETFAHSNNIFEILDNFDWVFQDLSCVQQELSKLVPPKWDIFKTYYDIYYAELHLLITRLIESEPETAFIIDILDFDNKFQEIMVNEFKFKKSEVESIIGEVEKEQLFKDYLNLLVMMITGWMTNLSNTEQDVFRNRITAPETDSEKLYLLEGTKIVFQMFTQQCDAASGSGQGKILAGAIKEFSTLLIKRQQGWSELVKSEVHRLLLSNNPELRPPPKLEGEIVDDSVPPGLIEYLTALANDQMRGADYTEAISSKYGSMVSKKYSSQIHEDLENVIDGFANLAKECCDALIVMIFDDLKVVMRKIFTKEWLNSTFAQQIADTLLEYLGDLKHSMNSYLFEILCEEVVEETLLKYLDNLNSDVKFPKDPERFLGAVKRDFETFYKLFIQFLSQDVIEEKFKIVEHFMDLATEQDLDQIATIWGSTVQSFNDIKIEFLSAVLKARPDVDHADAKLVVPKAKEVQQRYLTDHQFELAQSFMGRFNLSKKLKKDYL
ncbi:SNARE-binding exocyst subunit SEC6 [Cyberlindnera jadinii NRRL Y-1542]|uniref:Exocyst complex component Sec6 n=1 Tax=Cyberlindnera jadinii (strain ATCC 18201 / CBS 1600 / BCRC 20928 / JCM 3617 / NBRC 0987 / NRRL Y-1542) TaxID=983966 RepID=A0A1E4RX61_CYBJN|nr:exocyst complex component Sec6 [Cyberlindnera jadinii NRRL Y-1542]ODV71781.1 exocyst complex component Sec6 [Cyberlindnera jadinii NRRL Y-1542]